MADIRPVETVKLICGMISQDVAWFSKAEAALRERYGPIDQVSPDMPFDFTSYYDKQMGSPLLRRFVAFEKSINPGKLAEIKRETNDLEARFAAEAQQAWHGRLAHVSSFTQTRMETTGGTPVPPEITARRAVPRPARPINLDPGYVAPSKLVLASMKDFSHRVYLGGGVYAEVTLLYRGGWKKLEWTFPDYASGLYDEFLTAARDSLARRRGKEQPT